MEVARLVEKEVAMGVVRARVMVVVSTAVAEEEGVAVAGMVVVAKAAAVGQVVGAKVEAEGAVAVRAGEWTAMVVEETAAVPLVAAVVEASTRSERRKKCTARSVPRRQPPR